MKTALAYNVRSVLVRRWSSVMTALGIALPVAVLVAALALVNGLRAAFESSGSPLNVLVLRKGATSELSSAMTREIYRQLLVSPAVGRGNDGQPLVSLELVTVVTVPTGETPGMSATLRGIQPAGVALRDLKLGEGRWFRSGQREIVVGRFVADRSPQARVARSLRLGRHDWRVVGIVDTGKAAVNSEVLGPLEQVAAQLNRAESLSSVLVRAEDRSAVPALVNALNDDRRLNVNAQAETDYYAAQTASGAPLQALGLFVAAIMALGSSCAVMNTMYGAVARRGKELGTLRVLGFSSRSVLLGVLAESVTIASLGGLAGCVLVLPLNALTTSVGNFVTLSEVGFRFVVDGQAVGVGMLFALVMGSLGGFLPARLAARKTILAALRDP